MTPDATRGPAVRREPLATYRVQLHGGFTFDAAAGVAGYLEDLGVTHLYLSPILQASPGSTHGYDVVDHGTVNEELGGAAGYERLGAALGAARLGQLLDIVPNHMAIAGAGNRWWWDVLRSGPSSRYARYFDVDWESHEAPLRNAVLLPVLADHYGRELEAGNLTIAGEGGDFLLRYFQHAYPVDPASLGPLLTAAAARIDDEQTRVDLERLAVGADRIPPASGAPEEQAQRRRQVDELTERLHHLLADGAVSRALDEEVERWNADPDRLDGLLGAQHYRLAWWRSAGENLDYRRFFDISDLAAIRVEEPEVFADSHRLVLRWLREGVLDGVRIDHIDGLLDPRRYLSRLAEAAPDAWILVEKILEAGEALPPDWPVAGTTGYDWLARVGDVLGSRAGWERLVAAYEAWTGETERFDELAHTAKHEVMDGPLATDLTRLVGRLATICERHRRHRDHTRRDLRDALAEVAAAFPVYRTYVTHGPDGRLRASERDAAVVEGAVRTAAMRRPDLDEDLLGLVRDILLGRMPGREEADVAMRFQQFTGPVMAKAVEDTTFYRYLPLLSRNEVGGDPGRLDDGLDAFHDSCRRAHAELPAALLALSTHDTKRSEDVRARISVLAEMPDEWAAAVERWWDAIQGQPGAELPPDRNTAWLIAQTVVGAWPLDEERATLYVEKATREAKRHTSWTDPDPVYDQAAASFVRAAIAPGPARDVLESVVRVVTPPGRAVSLSQKLLTLVAPGVPDVYQGSELWDLSLVDPDNRRPVDYALRRRLLASGRVSVAGALAAWQSGDDEGITKLHLVRSALRLRAERPAWFQAGEEGAWDPLVASGPAAAHAIAARRGRAVAVATRWPLTLLREGGWRDTNVELPAGVYEDRLGGGRWSGPVALAELLAGLPVALLVPVSGAGAGAGAPDAQPSRPPAGGGTEDQEREAS
ncbi:MAG: malto-oligosyltrehalose synthase [Actinomycetota bacterium]|nr:malto-oligosyltrehalose synthase [Actinomycetota bacterium]